ncbi:MAG: hypothetical protein ACOX17_03380 [Christensenellales bacterium]
MERIWVKLIKQNKRIRDQVFQSEGLEEESGYASLFEIVSREMDIPSPVLLSKHMQQMNDFNHTRFFPEDFLEAVHFDTMDIERLVDKKDK